MFAIFLKDNLPYINSRVYKKMQASQKGNHERMRNFWILFFNTFYIAKNWYNKYINRNDNPHYKQNREGFTSHIVLSHIKTTWNFTCLNILLSILGQMCSTTTAIWLLIWKCILQGKSDKWILVTVLLETWCCFLNHSLLATWVN